VKFTITPGSATTNTWNNAFNSPYVCMALWLINDTTSHNRLSTVRRQSNPWQTTYLTFLLLSTTG